MIVVKERKNGRKHMKNLQDEQIFMTQLLDMLEKQLGSNVEIVLHDLTKDYASTIVDIRNGHVTGRKKGGAGSNLGLEVLAGSIKDGNRFNYITKMKNNRLLRSSSLYIHDDTGKVIGCLCINADITESVKFESFLNDFNQYSLDNVSEEAEVFAEDVGQLLEFLLQDGQSKIGKPAAVMNKEEKLRFIHYLNQKGAFLITKAGDRIQEVMGISKNTMYSYLDLVKKNVEE